MWLESHRRSTPLSANTNSNVFEKLQLDTPKLLHNTTVHKNAPLLNDDKKPEGTPHRSTHGHGKGQ